MEITLPILVYALLGGLLPALLWLWFFNHEDPHPEPRGMLVKTFIAGMITVIVAMVFQEVLLNIFGGVINDQVLLAWAITEETLKFSAAWLVALRTKAVDEPVDAIIYMVTVALGFAALENSLFLLAPLSEAAYFNTALTGGMRFVGATLLHVIASGTIGALIGASFYRRKKIRHEAVAAGLAVGILLHWGFNLLIIDAGQTTILRIFGLVWIAVIVLMLLFERIKHLRKRAPYPPNSLNT
ncbi:MAG: PrsW family glutamic-type intramembrane protease [Candidatus Paceibacterota bacterium]